MTKTTKDAFRDHVNPDGSRGGEVAVTATIHPNVYVPTGAIVLGGVIVEAGAKITHGDLITPDGVVRFDGPDQFNP